MNGIRRPKIEWYDIFLHAYFHGICSVHRVLESPMEVFLRAIERSQLLMPKYLRKELLVHLK